MKPKRPSKPFQVEHRPIKPNNNPRRAVSAEHEALLRRQNSSNPWREERAAFNERQRQLAKEAMATALLLEIEASVERIRRNHNNPDEMRDIARREIKGGHIERAEKITAHMEFEGNRVSFIADDGCTEQLRHHASIAMPGVDIKYPDLDKSMPNTPTGKRAFIKSMWRGE